MISRRVFLGAIAALPAAALAGLPVPTAPPEPPRTEEITFAADGTYNRIKIPITRLQAAHWEPGDMVKWPRGVLERAHTWDETQATVIGVEDCRGGAWLTLWILGRDVEWGQFFTNLRSRDGVWKLPCDGAQRLP